MWAIAGFLCIAAVVGIVAASTTTCVVGLSTGTDTWCGALIPVAGAPIAIIYALVAGLPAYFLFRRLRFASWWQYALGGLLVAVPAWYVLSRPFSGASWKYGAFGYFESLNHLGSGLFAGLVFYFLVRTRRPTGNSTHRWIVRAMLLLPLGLMAYPMVLTVLNYNGFCFKEGRFLSEQEKFRLVVEREIQYGPPFEPVLQYRPGVSYWSPAEGDKISHWRVKGHDGPVEPILYRGADEFFAQNPNCCEMRPFFSSSEGGFLPSFWDRALGDCSGGVVRVTGLVRFRDQAGKEHQIVHGRDVLLSNCGRELKVPTLK
jgi:hypothetical protein